MKKNVGTKEKYVRIGLGVAAGIAALKFRKNKLVSGLLFSAAASNLKSGVSQYCPLKSALGFENLDLNKITRKFPPAPVQGQGAEASAI